MVMYAKNELYSITDFTKQIGSVVNKIKEHTYEKVGILKNNKLEAVLIDIEEYERLQEAYDLLEHIEIAKIVEERKGSDTISFEELLAKEGIDYDDL